MLLSSLPSSSTTPRFMSKLKLKVSQQIVVTKTIRVRPFTMHSHLSSDSLQSVALLHRQKAGLSCLEVVCMQERQRCVRLVERMLLWRQQVRVESKQSLLITSLMRKEVFFKLNTEMSHSLELHSSFLPLL